MIDPPLTPPKRGGGKEKVYALPDAVVTASERTFVRFNYSALAERVSRWLTLVALDLLCLLLGRVGN